MNVVVEIAPDQPEEIRIRVKRADGRLDLLRETVERALKAPGEIAVKRGEEECFIPVDGILFAETAGDKVWVHTASDAFQSPLRLYELASLLPRGFARAGKGCIVNTRAISSLSRSPTGVGEARFSSGEKKVYISRMYYKIVRDVIEEERLKS